MLKTSLPTVALAVGVLLVAFWASGSSMSRFSTLDVPALDPEGPIGTVYLQMQVPSQGEAEGKCLVGGRGRTTSKRSESGPGKASWRCRSEFGTPPTYVAESKLQPSYLFVPMTEVEDLAYPVVFEGLRHDLSLPLPPMRWVHLFYERQFRGLYLEVEVPTRAFAAATESGRLELLAVRDDALICYDRKLRPRCPIYNLAVADGVFPEPAYNPASQQLLALSDGTERAFVLSDRDYAVLHPLPLPFSLRAVMRSAGSPYSDQRYARWLDGDVADSGMETATDDVSSETSEASYGKSLKSLLRVLPESIVASCEVMDCDADAIVEGLRQSPSLHWIGAQRIGEQRIAAPQVDEPRSSEN